MEQSVSVIKYGRDIPTFVRKFREDFGLSQNDLAKRLRVHGQYVSNVERGVATNPISFCSLLFAICPKDRQTYLTDLIAEAGAERALRRVRVKRKKK